MAKKPKIEITSIDDYFKEMRAESHSEVAESFEQLAKYTDEHALNKAVQEIFQPAQQELYESMKADLDKLGESHEYIKKDQKKDLQRITVDALKKFFKKARPSVLEPLTDDMDIDDQYKSLIKQYNEFTGGGREGSKLPAIDKLIEKYIDDENATIGELKNELMQSIPQYALGSANTLRIQAYSHFIGSHHTHDIAGYLADQAEEKLGLEIKNPGKFINQDKAALNGLYESIEKNAFEKGPEQYHLQKKGAQKE